MNAEIKAKKRRLVKRVLTLVSKLEELQEAERDIYCEVTDLPSVENIKQELYGWYAQQL